ncbi:HAMP domain-containing sensor histidine kinase [Cyanobacterium aponinum UTEX 3221]|uniref:sensor histidine kinase n=1 Tax=Cyanobacterium aponinum TaxID=379064 RepID=UPI002B4BBB69|nr:HAMP domain-containing sensor histidine kinase [Cyanobacterium aponinum]WRL40136.1 HAMP domain-containing sensor histidine kinase [Cyanobacterium aponinum UTEX 3221]
MIISECLSIKLVDLILEAEWNSDFDDCSHSTIKAHHEWEGAIASLEKLLSTTVNTDKHFSSKQGIVISSPTPVINNLSIISHLTTVVFSPSPHQKTALMPSDNQQVFDNNQLSLININLDNNDILNQEQFCLVFTEQFSLLMVKEINYDRQDSFHFSFDPIVTEKAWLLLLNRLTKSSSYDSFKYLKESVNYLLGTSPNYKIVETFNKNLLKHIKKQGTSDIKSSERETNHQRKQSISLKKTPIPPYPELELLQALTHEIRTPLTTIKTITKLLQKKAKLNPDLGKYLETIEQECTEQINRMELIFKAVELESKSSALNDSIHLVPTSLENILNQTIPTWQKQAQRRNIILDVIIPKKLPQIISDPAILSQILSGLMEKFTRSLPSGCHFQLVILPVGNQLKLQFLSESSFNYSHSKCLGKLLLFQPETGSLSLSNDVTRNIFHALGGKFTIKQKPNKGKILTIFLPLGNSKSYAYKVSTTHLE